MKASASPVFATALLGALILAAGVARADDRSGRFTMTPTDGGFLRLDTETGAVAFCSRKDAGFSCEPTPEAQAATRAENDKLRAENKILKDELRAMEETFGLAKPGDAKPGEPKVGDATPGERPGGERPGGSSGKMQLPTEQDVDKAFDYMEKMMKKLRERLKKLEEGEKPGQQL